MMRIYYCYFSLYAHQFCHHFVVVELLLSIYAHTKRSHVFWIHTHTRRWNGYMCSHTVRGTRASNSNSLRLPRAHCHCQRSTREDGYDIRCEHEFINSNRKFNYTSCLLVHFVITMFVCVCVYREYARTRILYMDKCKFFGDAFFPSPPFNLSRDSCVCRLAVCAIALLSARLKHLIAMK